ncbi:MAG: ribonuclease P protein component [Verrucomicrobiota bacterium]
MRFPKHRRMARSSEYRRVREEGTSYRGRHLILGVLVDESIDDLRVGFITTKRLGNAVMRNRVRRRMRMVLVELGDLILPGHYLVTVARPAAAEATFFALRKEWKWLGHRAGLFAPSKPAGDEGDVDGGGFA